VNVTTVVEREEAGWKQNIPYIIRAANRKTFREIHQEIRATQVEDVVKALEGFKWSSASLASRRSFILRSSMVMVYLSHRKAQYVL
jgi:hypothetical protein